MKQEAAVPDADILSGGGSVILPNIDHARPELICATADEAWTAAVEVEFTHVRRVGVRGFV